MSFWQRIVYIFTFVAGVFSPKTDVAVKDRALAIKTNPVAASIAGAISPKESRQKENFAENSRRTLATGFATQSVGRLSSPHSAINEINSEPARALDNSHGAEVNPEKISEIKSQMASIASQISAIQKERLNLAESISSPGVVSAEKDVKSDEKSGEKNSGGSDGDGKKTTEAVSAPRSQRSRTPIIQPQVPVAEAVPNVEKADSASGDGNSAASVPTVSEAAANAENAGENSSASAGTGGSDSNGVADVAAATTAVNPSANNSSSAENANASANGTGVTTTEANNVQDSVAPPAFSASSPELVTVSSPVAEPTPDKNANVSTSSGQESSSQQMPAPPPTILAASHLVLSEIQVGGLNNGDEFIELYNPTESDVALSGWSVQYVSGAADTITDSKVLKKDFDAGNVIKSHAHFLVARGLNGANNDYAGKLKSCRADSLCFNDDKNTDGYVGGVTPDLFQRVFALSGSSSGGNIFLVSVKVKITGLNDTAIIDELSYGDVDLSVSSKAGVPGKSQSLERKTVASGACVTPNGSLNDCDTDDNAADFIINAAPNPQSST